MITNNDLVLNFGIACHGHVDSIMGAQEFWACAQQIIDYAQATGALPYLRIGKFGEAPSVVGGRRFLGSRDIMRDHWQGTYFATLIHCIKWYGLYHLI